MDPRRTMSLSARRVWFAVAIVGAIGVASLAPGADAAPNKAGMESCKQGGWVAQGFRNQGQCVSFYAQGGPSTTGPSTTGPSTTGPSTTGPSTTGLPTTSGPPTTVLPTTAQPTTTVLPTTAQPTTTLPF